MTLAIGSNLGPYEIVAMLGAGGMGEVYRARDSRLGRDVAVKVLPGAFAGNTERLRRFELEAKAASLLSHPGILSVFDVGTVDGVPYIVTELLEGENLRERVSRGPGPPRRSVEIAAAIADALAAAHARGIVHRDLKPENVFLTRDGRVKILDFGIAKLTAPEGSELAGLTVTALTDVGVAVGTLGYMPPEQLRGERTDHRADLFALGAILHEMIAGTQPFRRTSRVQTVNAVLESDPPELGEDVPPGVRRIVSRLLEKSPEARFQSARDLAFALNAISDSTTAATARESGARRPAANWTTAAALALAAAAISAALAAAVTWRLREPARPEALSIKRFSFEPPAVASGGIDISADGSRLVFSGGFGADRRLYQRRLDELESKPIPGTEDAYAPFFSPDGQWIAFASQQKLRKVPVGGGPSVIVGDVGALLQGTWRADGTIVIAEREGGLKTVSAEGGTPQPLTTPDKASGVIDHHAPFALPGGALLFTIHAGPERFSVAVRSTGGDERILIEDAYQARYVTSGHVLYGKPDGLYAAPFDLANLRLAGPPVLVVDMVLAEPASGSIEFAVGHDGTLAYMPALPLGGRRLMWADRKGQTEPLPTPPRGYEYPTLSPDGRRVAFEIREGARSDIWVYEFSADSMTRITFEGTNTRPVWTPDGRRVSYSALRPDGFHLMWQALDGKTAASSLLKSHYRVWPGAWAPDGQTLIFVEDPPTSLDSLKVLRVGSAAPPEVLLGAPPVYSQPHVSPDGHWLAYLVFERQRPQVFVRPVAGGAARQITSDGGGSPRWSRDGTELFYRRLDTMFRIPVRPTPELQLGRAEKLFDAEFVGGIYGPPGYDVTADGQRFITVRLADEEGRRVPIHVVVNWFEELRRRVPAAP